MRIAYVSFEYPPDTAVGGIATYVHQVSQMMKSRGHDVEVFCSSPTRSISEIYESGSLVHRIKTDDRVAFSEQILPIFEKQHAKEPFDLIESPEYHGDGIAIKKRFPDLPLVVKLHTPKYFILELDTHYASQTPTSYQKFRFLLGGLIRGKPRQPYWTNTKWKKSEDDTDYIIASLADQLHTPSVSLGDIVAKQWNINRQRILDVPYPFIPNEDFLQIPIIANTTKNVTFVGRLEVRKGLVELVKAIPLICAAIPEAKFRFVGKSLHSPIYGMNMKEYIETKLHRYSDRIEFMQLTPPQIPIMLAQTDVCVFPSIWENFPNVCLEAMSAGRAIVGSKQGGMKDMLEQPEAGLLVNPLDPGAIANAVVKLLNNGDLRVKLGEAARQKILLAYNKKNIGDLMEKEYSKMLY